MTSQIVIDPVTRIEGHAQDHHPPRRRGRGGDAQFHVTQFRGFEQIVQGRPFYEMPSIMARICGICPVSHLIASAKACDEILAVEPPPTGARPAPGDEPGPDRPVPRAQLLPPLLARPAVRLRRRPGEAQHLRRRRRRTRSWPATASASAGSASRSSSGWAASASTRPGSCPGGVDAPLAAETRDRILATIPEAIAAIERALAWYKASLAALGGGGGVVRRLPVRVHGPRRPGRQRRPLRRPAAGHRRRRRRARGPHRPARLRRTTSARPSSPGRTSSRPTGRRSATPTASTGSARWRG